MKKIFIIVVFITALGFDLFSQTYKVSGLVSDYNIGEPLIGVNIVYGQGKGTVTDINGVFNLNLPNGEYDLQISYIGFISQTKHVVVGNKDIFLNVELKTLTLNEVQVIGDIAKTRETPIAFSNITPAKIEEQLASQDIPMILNSTPGVYATQSGGGDGDARINIRGFSQRNVAVMLDGIPVNDMENGWVYWSNWFGLDAVMRGTQVQRGLGMSKLAIPSVGGTINITTKGIDAKKGVSIKQEVGNSGFLRTTLGMTTGRLDNGWGVTFAGSYKRGDGWVDQTWTEGWFYFLRVDKEIGKHVISLTAMGAPQKHGQRSYKKHIATFDREYAEKVGMRPGFIDTLDSYGLPIDMGLKYNPNWGYLSRAYITDTDTVRPNAVATSTANNYYHKPLFSLKDFWNVNDRLYVSNVAYLSIGSGGGRSFSPTPQVDTATNQQNLQSKYNSNMNIPYGFNTNKESSGIMRNAVNNHFWLGLLSTFDYKISDALSLSGGIDLRTYRGEHYREIDDLFGGNFYKDQGNKNESDTIKKYEGDRIGYNNDALVRWAGLFTQLKYQNGNLTTFINLTASFSGYKRIDYFLPKTLKVGDTTLQIAYGQEVEYQGVVYDHKNPGLKTNETDWKYIGGFTVKGGLNYNLNEKMNVFMNLGYLSKAPRFQNVFDRQNKEFLEIRNEKVKAVELGYSYLLSRMTLNANAYYTIWENRPSDRRVSFPDPNNPDIRYTANINKMNALHKGIELEFAYRVLNNLTFEALLSLGDWKWTSKDSALIYNDDGELIGRKPFNAKGLYVGDAAQFQNRESLRWEIIRGLYVSGSYTWFGKNYSEFNPLELDPDENPWAFDDEGNPRQSWRIPNYFTLDFHAGYSWNINKVGFQLRASVLNALDNVFITDAQNNDPYLFNASSFDANSAGVFMGLGRRFNISLKLRL
ncbi:MAG: TonB-dependent receptor plug domain-containing protein [Chlorobi bacterium]|nr:TonB-dependent receptor plug domain-containing protein [Chlorobiota bacterium]